MTFRRSIEDKSFLAEKSVKYPTLDDLPLDHWIEQIYLHEQRHIEQIKEIKILLEVRHYNHCYKWIHVYVNVYLIKIL